LSYYKTETEDYFSYIREKKIKLEVDIEQLNVVLLTITLLVFVKCLIFLFDNKEQTVTKFWKFLYLFGYIILPFIFIVKISFGIKDYNPKIIIGLFILIWTNDTFAYLVGKSVGKHKLFKRISPKKTVEGFLGGVVFAVFAGYLISKLYIEPNPDFSEKSILIWTIIALIVGVFGTIGDLIESKFKRIAEVKDSGKIMPGHGGILDRLDSVIFASPIVYLFYQILSYVS
jgi:phosphatidate cytidylyltransferase